MYTRTIAVQKHRRDRVTHDRVSIVLVLPTTTVPKRADRLSGFRDKLHTKYIEYQVKLLHALSHLSA